MGITYETVEYYFRPYRGNSNFWLNREGSGAISAHQNANLYSATGDPDQRLRVHLVNGGCQLQSALTLDYSYGLNIYQSTKNCDFYPVANNFADALIDLLTVNANENLYRIKLINHNLFLTPAGNYKNANLSWQPESGGDNQIWKLCESQSGGGVTPSEDYTYPTEYRGLSQLFHGTSHTGIDIRDKSDDHNIYAFTDGVVAYTQNADDPSLSEKNKTMGNCIIINHFNPDYTKYAGTYARTVYMHMKNTPMHKVGDPVANGEKLGVIGTTGNSTGLHLHFVLAVGNEAEMEPGKKVSMSITQYPLIDPLIYLPEYHLDPGFSS